jgi:hypothetical protein
VPKACHFPESLPGMELIEDLNGTGKRRIGMVPDACGSVSEDDLLLCPIPAAVPCLPIDAAAERAGGFASARIGGGTGIGNRIAFLIPRGWREEAAQLHCAGMRRLSAPARNLPLVRAGRLAPK